MIRFRRLSRIWYDAANRVDRASKRSQIHDIETTVTNASAVLKQVNPDTAISNRAMSILNSFVNGKIPRSIVFKPPVWLID